MIPRSSAHEYATANGERFIEELEALTRIPSISTDTAHGEDIARAADWLKERMQKAGLQGVEVFPTAGHPVVYGEWNGAGSLAPTVLLYAHYDVQPAELTDGWHTDPFTPTRRDGKIFARGVGDDKLHSAMIIQLAESFLKSGEMPPVNLKLVIEGEEENASPNLMPWIRENRQRLKADYVLICDGAVKSPERPTIVYGLRGALGMEFTVHGPSTDLHSGLFGGCVHNPAQVIAEMVAKLHHPDGRVAVPGFYDDVSEMGADERHQLNLNPLTPEALQSETGIPDTWGEPGFTLLERSVARPTLEINGIYGGFSGEGMKTVIPATASAKITCRLVNDQNPSRIAGQIESYLQQIKPSTVTLQVTHQGSADPVTVPIDSPLLQALERSMEKTWGRKPEYKRMGGSVPVAPVFQNELGVPTLLVGFNVENGGFHGPNEFIHIELFHKGLETMVHLLRDLGTNGNSSSSIDALEGNLWALWRRFGLGRGCALHEDEHATFFETPIPNLPYNGVLRFRSGGASEDVDKEIGTIFERYGKREVPFFWLIHPTTLPLDLDRRLEARGLSEVESFPGMAVALDAVPQPDRKVPPGIEIREVEKPGERDSILEMIAWRWDVPQEARGLLPDVSSDFDVGQPGSSVRCWLAWKDGKPVSKVVLNITGEVCGIYGVATRPEARGLGLARNMTLMACEAARESGCRICVLHSTEMAVNLYRKIGFREQDATFRLFCKAGALHM